MSVAKLNKLYAQMRHDVRSQLDEFGLPRYRSGVDGVNDQPVDERIVPVQNANQRTGIKSLCANDEHLEARLEVAQKPAARRCGNQIRRHAQAKRQCSYKLIKTVSGYINIHRRAYANL